MELTKLYKESADTYDKWGSAMGAFFGAAAELSHRGESTPHHWQYSPGLSDDPREPDDYLYADFAATDTDDLVKFGNIMERYTRNLDRIGESY